MYITTVHYVITTYHMYLPTPKTAITEIAQSPINSQHIIVF